MKYLWVWILSLLMVGPALATNRRVVQRQVNNCNSTHCVQQVRAVTYVQPVRQQVVEYVEVPRLKVVERQVQNDHKDVVVVERVVEKNKDRQGLVQRAVDAVTPDRNVRVERSRTVVRQRN